VSSVDNHILGSNRATFNSSALNTNIAADFRSDIIVS
jgi:hypothetical protein